ncbi:MAG TPA: hypothetical protein VHL59_09035, partial [Thermoanaerobaculia bacterium]|nr:hypothetical protein [Thermoanaerobaculia bacterium]
MRKTLFGFVLFAFLAARASGQAVSPNIARGFDADKAYAMGEVDAVNLFNGNVNVPVSLGAKYSVGAHLSYQFTLMYGGNSWEKETVTELIHHPSGPAEEVTYGWAYPSRRDTAGFGWRLHFGRLYLEGHSGCRQLTTDRIGYEGPDGAVHCFYDTLHEGKTTESAANTFYTRDGSYLRLRRISNSEFQIDFPDGTVHEFTNVVSGATGSGVAKMRDPFGNFVTVDYAATGAPPPQQAYSSYTVWRVDDSYGRKHFIYFKPTASYQETSPGTEVSHRSVAEVRLATFDDPAVNGDGFATYTFAYEGESTGAWSTLPQPRPEGTLVHPNIGGTVAVTLLQKINLPEGGTYELTYDGGQMCDNCSGILTSLRLPTLGQVTWTYENLKLPENSGAPWNLKSGGHYYTASAVARRDLYSPGSPPKLIGRRVYQRKLDPEPTSLDPPVQQRVTVTDLDGAAAATVLQKSDHFFSVCVTSCGSDKPPIGAYGLPFSKWAGTDGHGRHLSALQYGAGPNQAWTTPLRRTYLAYDADIDLQNALWSTDVNRRVQSQRTVFEDDVTGSQSAFADSVNSDFDGLGHYRTTTNSASFDVLSHTARTDYNPGGGSFPGSFVMPSPTAPWLLNLYSSTKVTHGAQTVVTSYAFGANGLLLRKRQHKDPVAGSVGPNDVITTFAYDSRGNVTQENWYGGDDDPNLAGEERVGTETPLASATLNNRTTGMLVTPLDPLNGVWTTTSAYSGSNFELSDVSVDPNTGDVAVSRDSAEVATKYSYDRLGRLTQVAPAGRAVTKYAYQNAAINADGTLNGATVKVTTHPAANPAGPPLTAAEYVYDAFGRLVKRRQKLPGHAVDSEQRFVFDGLHRTTFVSLLDDPAQNHGTTTAYDSLGRVTAVTAADGASTTFTYTGVRKKSRTVMIATPGSTSFGTQVTTHEQYDGLGRLVGVDESSGPTSATAPSGAKVTTAYAYDARGQLKSVKMTGAEGVVQSRVFDRDGRGFLRWETQPEAGMIAYTYDARGKVLSKSQSAAQTHFDLTFRYDAAERLTTVSGRNPDNLSTFRPIKEFEFGAFNDGVDLRRGKLVSAKRYNYPVPFLADGTNTITVTEAYRYKDAAGRRTERTTTIDFGQGAVHGYTTPKVINQSVAYNDLDLPATINYPLCIDCGAASSNPARSLAPVYEQGIVTNLPGLADLSYWPNGMRRLVNHSNGIVDTWSLDEANRLARPSRLESEVYSGCVAASIVQITPPTTINPSSSVTLSVTVDGTGPFTYTWSANGQTIPGANQSSYVASPTASTTYGVNVTNACRTASTWAQVRVEVGSCVAPAIVTSGA